MPENHGDDKTQSFTSLTKDTLIGHYRIIEKIGAGGMGEVYLAEDTQLKRQVALKFLPANMCGDEDCLNRFKREAQATAKLNHPNIVHIYEVSEFNGRPFFAMEHIEGESLYDKIKEKKITINEAIDLTRQICEGLHKAHEAGIVHRDIKPSNIILDNDDRPKILDFGLATILDAEKLTKTGSTLGTIGYMSPEQVNGEKVDARSDLFSVGVILYEMLTGRRPFQAEYEAATMNAILHDTPEPISRYKSGVTGELQQIVSKALEKDPDTRYQHADGMQADLKRLAQPTIKPVAPWWNRYILTGAVVALIIVLIVLKPWNLEFSSSKEAIAQENRLAIMYFDNLADPSDSLKLGEIVTNLLIIDLSESKYVNVVSSQRLYDILKYMGREGEKKIDRTVATEISQKTKSKWMLLGSILQVEPSIIITSQIVDMETGSTVASQRINGDEGEKIFDLVDKLTIEIKNDLSLPAAAQDEIDLSVSSVTSSTEAYRYYLEGYDFLRNFQWGKAYDRFTRAVEIDSTFALAYYGMAWSAPDAESILNAILKAEEYIDSVPESDKHKILSVKAQIYGNRDEAINELTKALEIKPDDKDEWHTLGILYRSFDIDKTLECFQRAIEIDSLFTMPYNDMAYIYNDMGDHDKSIWAINKYIEIAPDEPNPYDSRGELYALNGKLKEAIASSEKVIDLDSNFWGYPEKLANLYMFDRQYDKAESLYQIMASHQNKHSRAAGRLAMANIPIYQGKFKDALRLLEIGIEADLMEDNESATIGKIAARANIFDALGNWEAAFLEDLRNKKLSDKYKIADLQIVALGNLASRYARVGNLNQADSIRKELINIVDSTRPRQLDYYWSAQGLYHFTLQNFDSAAFYFEKTKNILEAFNDRIMIARSYFEMNRLGESVAMYEKTMKRYENFQLQYRYNRAKYLILFVKAHYWLAQAYEASGWNNKAIEQYEIFLDIWKNADEGLKSVEDAKARLARLKSST